MGPVYAELELIRSDDLALWRAGYIEENQIRRMRVMALVDRWWSAWTATGPTTTPGGGRVVTTARKTGLRLSPIHHLRRRL